MQAKTVARGYGARHKALRKRYARMIAFGGVPCVRCGRLIGPGMKWHLDHTDDRSGYLGPSHQRCNTRAAALKRHAIARARRQPKPWVSFPTSREW